MNETEFITREHCDDTRKLCEETFMSKKTFYNSLWVISITLIGIISGSIAWAMATSNDLSKLNVTVNYQAKETDHLKTSIETKLDRIERWTQQQTPLKGDSIYGKSFRR